MNDGVACLISRSILAGIGSGACASRCPTNDQKVNDSLEL